MRRLSTCLRLTLLLFFCASTSVAGATTNSGFDNHKHNTMRLCKKQPRQPTDVRHHCATIGEVNPARPHQHAASPTLHIDSQAAIAGILATPCENTQLIPTESNIPVIRQATFCLIDQERARHDEQPLRPNSQLEQAAQAHSQDMVAEDYFSHYTSGGEGPAERIQTTGYIPPNAGWKIGENIAWGNSYLATPQSIVEAWIASPEHLGNILESNYRDSGIGVVPHFPASLSEGQSGAIYTQDFGVIEG